MRRTKEDAEQTRLKVIAAALELFSRNGYSNTTLAMISEAAGFSRGPIYWHFKNKDELFEAVLAYSQEPLEQLVAECRAGGAAPLAVLRHFIERWFGLLLENLWHRQSFEILLNKTELTARMAPTLARERALTRSILDLLGEQIAAAQAQQALPAGQPPAALARLLYASLMGLTHSWLFAPELFDLAQQADFCSERLLALLATP